MGQGATSFICRSRDGQVTVYKMMAIGNVSVRASEMAADSKVLGRVGELLANGAITGRVVGMTKKEKSEFAVVSPLLREASRGTFFDIRKTFHPDGNS